MGVKDRDQERAGTVGGMLNGTEGNLERGNKINLMLMVALCNLWEMNPNFGKDLQVIISDDCRYLATTRYCRLIIYRAVSVP